MFNTTNKYQKENKMNKLGTALFLIASLSACAEQPIDCSVFTEQNITGYILPFQKGASYKVEVSTGHYRKSNSGVGLYAVDFNMPIGTTIVAARAGKVVAVRDKFKDWNGKDLAENYVFIEHQDGTIARYFHLTHNGALVSEGERVTQGQIIAKSGNTGQSGGPHLHFDVQKCGPNLPPNYNKLPCGQTLPVIFKNTTPHQCGLEAGKTYKAL